MKKTLLRVLNIMDSQFEYDMDYLMEKNKDRRRKSAAVKRRRVKKIRLIRTIAGVTAGVLIFTGIIVSNVSKNKDVAGAENSETNINNSVNQDDSFNVIQINADISNALAQNSGITVKYPQVSESYKNIDSEAVLSPYIAVIDVENSEIIAGRNSDARIYPASMTKVMTLIVAVENLEDENLTYTFSNELLDPLVRQEASRAGFDPDETVGVEDLLYGLILPSGADSAAALAELAGGSQEKFVEMMNEKCKELGLVNTHFANPSGLHDEQQYTTPVEMAMILEYAMSNEKCAKILSTYQYTTKSTDKHPQGIELTSTMFSRMYGNEVEGVTIMAGKTGYTQEAKNCLVSYAEKNGHHYIALTAGADYKWHVIFDDFEIYKSYLP